ncbi:hypothetical protein FBU30_004796 [Linnemannia zychae]|nr:hypothetical protein FBU30_004796 [Linnemannia zychae]
MTVSILASVGGIPKILSASIDFTERVEITWDNTLIGSMQIGSVRVAGGKGDILQSTTFQITNAPAFGRFVKIMMSAEQFEWRLKSKATVKALGQTIKGLNIDKVLAINGLNSFANVQILGFSLPSDAPDGSGAIVTIQASIPNPSPIGMMLGTLSLDMKYQSTYLGRVTAKNVALVSGQAMQLSPEGTILRQTDPVRAAELSQLVSNYLANIVTSASAKGVSVLPDGVNAVSWLTNAITSTEMSVPLKAVQPLEVFKNIAINDLSLIMSEQTPWLPTVNSNSISADFKIRLC